MNNVEFMMLRTYLIFLPPPSHTILNMAASSLRYNSYPLSPVFIGVFMLPVEVLFCCRLKRFRTSPEFYSMLWL
jgi:hypothetical protein